MKKKILNILMSGLLILSMAGCGVSENQKNSTAASVAESAGEVTVIQESEYFTEKDLSKDTDEADAIKIELTKSGISTSAKGVSEKDGVITISEEGSYILSGEYEGQIVVDADSKAKITFILNGASIEATGKAALYVKSADKVFLVTKENTTNTITSKGEIATDGDTKVDAAVFAKSNLTIKGEGELNVTCETGNGITSKDNLRITSGTLNVEAGNHGLEGKDSVRICEAVINITSAQDGIHSGNDDDTTKGYTYIESGEITISAGDDGIHSDTELVISGGNINILKSYEGLEGLKIEITGGYIDLVASDDGLNAAGGADSSGVQGNDFFGKGNRGGMGGFEANTDAKLIISGGEVHVNAGGDGLDSNGYLEINGGVVYVDGPTNSGNGALDFGEGCTGTVNGGTIIAIGAAGMDETFSEGSTQASIRYSGSTYNAGTVIRFTDSNGNVLLEYTSKKSFSSVVFSCPQLNVGEKYTLTIGDTSTEITLDSLNYSEGSSYNGFGGGMGGFGGGKGNKNFGQNFDRNQKGDSNTDGDSQTLPEMPDGQSFPQMGDGQTPPEMPDGQSFPQMGDGQTPPEMPDGQSFPQMGDGQTPPEMPNGQNLPQNSAGQSVPNA